MAPAQLHGLGQLIESTNEEPTRRFHSFLYYHLRIKWAGQDSTIPPSPRLPRNAQGYEPNESGTKMFETSQARSWAHVHSSTRLFDEVESDWLERESGGHVVQSLGQAIADMVASRPTADGMEATPFWYKRAPGMPIGDYIARFSKMVDVAPEMLIVACTFIDKLGLVDPRCMLHKQNMHMIFLTCAMLAQKFYDPNPFHNEQWADAGGISNTLLNTLELFFLERISYDLTIPLEVFIHYRTQIARGAIAHGLLVKEPNSDMFIDYHS